LAHINGLTYDFLYSMAKELEAKESLLLLGRRAKSNQPLVLRRGGTAYRGFLEGRDEGRPYRLVLHLSNLELKAPEAAPQEKAPWTTATLPLLDRGRLEIKLAGYGIAPATALADPLLLGRVQDYRPGRGCALVSLEGKDIAEKIIAAEYHVSRKIDGEFTVLVFRRGKHSRSIPAAPSAPACRC